MLSQRPSHTGRWAGVGSLAWYAWAIDAVVLLPAAVLVSRRYDAQRAARFLAGAALTGMVCHVFLRWIERRTGPEPLSLGDPLSLARLSCANLLAGFVLSGVRDRAGPAGRLGWSLALLGATALDWLDGPLARRSGPTRHGGALDIEADSWLTLWSAIAAASWGGLPRWVVAPPIVRYIHPLLDLRAGLLPQGGGPGLSRVTGTTQMALLLAALAPVSRRPPNTAVIAVAAAISGGQLAVHAHQLRLHLRRRAWG